MSLDIHLQSRVKTNSLRSLRAKNGLIDFCSNDYLGFARDVEPACQIGRSGEHDNESTLGSTGSRLISGNSGYVEDLERFIAEYHDSEAGLIFNSGYDANLGLFSSVPQRGDTVLYDELCHASIRDGIRLGNSRAYSFPHNDLKGLEKLLSKAQGSIYVAVESVYSMDGDFADLAQLSTITENYHAKLIVDEAHATGLFGGKGEGRVVELGLQDRVFARVHTFGKALGRHGAIVLGDDKLRTFLINFARSFIYTTALPKSTLISVKKAYDKMSNVNYTELKLSKLQDLLKKEIKDMESLELINSFSPIQSLICGDNERAKRLSNELENQGIDVRPILSPTVKKGTERLRICLHEFNTEEEILKLVNCLKTAE